jgi:hypothetical protein
MRSMASARSRSPADRQPARAHHRFHGVTRRRSASTLTRAGAVAEVSRLGEYPSGTGAGRAPLALPSGDHRAWSASPAAPIMEQGTHGHRSGGRSRGRSRQCPESVISCAVPVVCRLGGIRIVLRSREDDRHEPHFHAMAAERGASIRIGDEYVYASTLTRAELAVVVGWAARRRLELRTAWDLVQDGRAWSDRAVTVAS